MKKSIAKILFSIVLLSAFILAFLLLYPSHPYGSYLWYSEPVGLHLKDKKFDKTLISMIDNDGNIKILEHNNKTLRNKIYKIRKNYEKNEHAHPVLLLLPDKRIMVIYSKHNMKKGFNYKISSSPLKISGFTEEKRGLISNDPKTTITYPMPFLIGNKIYIFCRGINWHPTVAKYTIPDKNGDIKLINKPLQIIQSSAKRPYVKYLLKGNKVYMAYTTGHADYVYPNWLYFSILDTNDLKLYDIKGNYLADINESPFKISNEMAYSPLIIDNTKDSRNTLWDLALDNDGNPVIAYVRISNDKEKHTYYVAKWNGQKWLRRKIANGGSYFHSTKDVEKTFSGGLSIDKDNTNIIWASVPRKGLFGTKYEIARITLDNKLKPAYIKFYTQNSRYNNVRPYNIKDDNKIIFLNGKYYYYANNEKYAGYPLKLKYLTK